MDDDAGILGRINELAREEHELSSANLAGRRPTRTERTSCQYRWTFPSFRRVV